MSKVYKTFPVEVKAIDAEAGIYEIMISTESIDRDQDIVEAAGAQIENYLKNPVVLADHRYETSSVIGKTLELAILAGKGIKSTFQFMKRGINEKADMVHDMFAAGYLNAASIGFMSQEREKRTNDAGDEIRGFLFKIWELLEWSIVAIPANPDALALAIKNMGADNLPSVEDVYKSFTHLKDSEPEEEPTERVPLLFEDFTNEELEKFLEDHKDQIILTELFKSNVAESLEHLDTLEQLEGLLENVREFKNQVKEKTHD